MKAHHLNCGTMRPFGGRLVSGRGSAFATAELVCHCLLLETDDGLVLVDTGIGLEDIRDPSPTLPWYWRAVARPSLDESETALRQVERLGFRAEDVRHVVLTHMDLDHAGGLRDFPHAEVHVLREELDGLLEPAAKARYPLGQRAHGPKWRPYEPTGERWFGFDGVREFRPDVLLVPLIGHTRGHTGVAVRTGGKWLLHAGDSYFFHGQLEERPSCPPGLALLEKGMETVRDLRLSNLERLRELVRDHRSEVDVFSAHDPVELARHQLHRTR
ncbi:glyoxylase-like metal-dependent hydrolase (beta-lactamase superfamily II) [Saccharothrix coeruleofusca]|uniref:MBL fold metallo-hydrolase n=1 Tax=Saccharothrix coeruleofusca TaxID=33919 RepID=UPI001AE7805B|nr:MBL fold metallo-hydrolase [Saccharothrix coeruleofusca]MBP2340579.1 glyoxylase-like metal-dependent hydrolase (beta-lactamase superfamily II) [Saccharothrix coeruleofusca]